ncbi:MAG: hypothetical protein CMD22_00030 [Flavobacteriales bacterium]|nr:hypothetical protein [Flavobacteriales bacterium]
MNRAFTQTMCFLLLSGCSSFDFSRVAPGYVEAFKSINILLNGYQESFITPELIKNIPYASLVLNIGKGPEGLMILESKEGNRTTWVSADGVYLVKDNGRIIQTKGLKNNLDEILYTVDFSDLMNVSTNQTYTYYVSLSEPQLLNLKIDVRFTKKNKQLVNILGKEKNLTLIEEEMLSKDLGWKVTNQYWVDEKSYIWKSVQTFSPKIPNLNISITKKPS